MPEVFKLRGSGGNVVQIRANSPEEAFEMLDEIEGMGSPVGGPAYRAGMQVLAPNNPANMIDVVKEGARIAPHLPGAVLGVGADYISGALKGLGGMVDSAIKMSPLPRSEYADVAFEPSNPVQSAGKTGAQIGTAGLASAALAPYAAGTGVGALATRAVLSPVGTGVASAAAAKASGASNREAVLTGVSAASLGKATGILGRLKGLFGSKVSPAQAREAIEEAENLLATKQIAAVEEKAVKAELSRVRKMAKMDAKAASKAPTAPVDPKTGLPVNPDGTVTVRVGGDSININPARLESGIKPIPPSKLIHSPKPEPKIDVVEAKPAFKGQQSAKGATKARFQNVRERTVKGWFEAGRSESFVRENLKKMFKLSDDEITDTIRIVSGKGTH